jgi:hypothetical protein
MANSQDFKVKNGLVVATTATIQSTTNSTSTTTGALKVIGGVGIGGNLYVGGTINGNITGTVIGTASTATNIAGGAANQIPYQSAAGATTFNSGLTFNGTTFTATNIVVPGTTASTSTTTGALQVRGGVGIGGGMYVGSDINIPIASGNLIFGNSSLGSFGSPSIVLGRAFTGDSNIISANYGTVYGGVNTGLRILANGSGAIDLVTYDGGWGVTGQGIGLRVKPNRDVQLFGTSASTSTTTGALQVVGGVGIGGDLYVGGVVTATSAITVGSGSTGLILQPLVGGGYAAVYSTNITPSTTNYTFATDGASPNFNGTYGVYFNISNVNKLQVTANNLNITPTAPTSSTSTGALTVAGGVGIGGGLFVGGTVTATLHVGNLTGTATTATNIAGGALGSIPYQTAAGTTAFIPIGTNGYVLTAGASTATWSAVSSLSAGSATTATNIAGGAANQIPYQSAAGITTFSSNLTFNGNTLQVNGGTYLNGATTVTNTLVVNSTLNSIGKATVYVTSTNTVTFADNTSTAGLVIAGTDAKVRLQLGVGNSALGPYGGWIQASYDNTGGNNGTEPLLLNPNGGFVGIGTTSPSQALQVKVATNGNFAVSTPNSGTGARIWVVNDAVSSIQRLEIQGNPVVFPLTTGADGMYFDASSGNLGLGVTPSAWSQGKAFEIGSVGYGLWYGTGSPSSTYLINNMYYNSGFKYAGTGQAAHYYQYLGQHVWSTAPSGTAGNAVTFTQAMTLDASGNLGIGTTSPGAKLQVNTGAVGTVGQIIQMVASQTADALRVARSDGNLILQLTPTGQLSIGDIASVASTVITTGPSTSTNANLKITASNAGNPNLLLQSAQGGGGGLGGPTSYVYFGDNNRALSYIGGTKINASGATASSDLVFGTTSDISTVAVTERMRLDSSGNLGIGTTSPGAKLDIYVSRTSSTNAIALYLTDNVTGGQTDGVYKSIRSGSNNKNSISEIRFVESDGSNNNTSIAFATQSVAGGLTERMRITQSGALAFAGASNYGSSGQILQSNGNAAPTWVNASSITSGSASLTSTYVGFGSGSNTLTGSSNLTWNGSTLSVTGSIVATTKSFLITHPTKSGMKLRYGSLEGPENGVYVRGKLTNNNIIELPDYWTGLVDNETITVNLTSIGQYQKLYIKDISNNTVIVGIEDLSNHSINCFYTVWAERKDVDKLVVEF